MTEKASARFELLMPAAQRARLNGLASETGIAASVLTRLAIDRLLAEPDPLGTRGTTMATNTQESSRAAIAKAEAWWKRKTPPKAGDSLR